MPARWGASWALSPRATVTRRRPAASPLPAATVRQAVPPEPLSLSRPVGKPAPCPTKLPRAADRRDTGTRTR